MLTRRLFSRFPNFNLVVSRHRDAVFMIMRASTRLSFATLSCDAGHRGIKYLRTSKVACMCFECCDCVLMKEVEQKAREEGIVPLNKLARYEAEEVRRRVNLGRDVPAVLALLPERPEKERKKGYFGAQVEGWCLARRAEFTDPVDGWQILVDPQQCARGVPSRHRRDSSPGEEVVGGFFFEFEAVTMLRAGPRR